ncbi:lipopolysaccharide biosynthesis protein [Noviherbaspirillum pedocola]|uniref:lipopolysaccharide biosynthesis protein n=1 Tax=Noviherbaspirillum pedocola TaxID=2801341 RepID=UPI001F3D5775|nr:oligosaccharide flippase family protein [Noviherbaspirillum pedocola]
MKKNILASWVSQVYVSVAGMLMVPFYLRYMGTEAYGLVGFFAMLQVWFQLMDLGLTQTMSREAARFRGGAIDALSLRRLLRSLEALFLLVAIAGALAIGLAAPRIASDWLQARHIDIDEVRYAAVLMGMLVALRWVSGLYRGVISGFEALVWLNACNAAIATARFMLVIPLLMLVGGTPRVFFNFQLVVAVLELGLLVWQTYRLLPQAGSAPLRWDWRALGGLLKFSMGVAFTSTIWVAMTQLDKLMLSKLLPLDDYGVFTLAVLIASAVTLIATPITSALQPRMAQVAASGRAEELIGLYRRGTQIVGLIAAPAMLVLVCFPEQVLGIWTGNAAVAASAAPILQLYAFGNGVLAFGAFPYYLQFARGELRLHVIGNVLFLVILLPALIWAAQRYGALGAGYAWAISNLAYFLLWIPLVHRRFMRGSHFDWLLHDVAAVVAPPTVAAFMLRGLIAWPQNRFSALFLLVAIGLALMLLSGLGASSVRQMVQRRWRLGIPALSIKRR